MRIRAALAMGVLLAVVVAMPVSAAGRTLRQSGSAINGPFPEDLCDGFTIWATLHQSWTENDLLAQDGTPIAAEVLVVQYLELTANGHTLTSVPTHDAMSLRFDSQWNPVSWIEHGVMAKFVLPGGGVAIWAGRVDDLGLTFTGTYTMWAVCPFLA